MRAENERAAAALAERERQQRAELEQWKEDQEKLLDDKKVQMEQEIAQEREKHEEQLKQKQLELEERFEQHKRDFENEQQLILKRKIAEISAQHKHERDREIERAIESMEAEAQAGRKDLQEALRRNKEQYEAELKELAETERATLRRYQDAQARVRQTEAHCAELEVTISQLETRNKVLIEKNSQLEARAEEVRSSCEGSWKGKVDDLHRDIDNMKKTHEEQMHQLYAKVKVAVARKDSAIQALTRETAKYQEKITLLEQKLQQQRKDFLKQK
ncbi:centrosomal protein of 131 kDa-like [Ostrinia nubilalis]|uniref:centrosomal protein of 131 kDa-like n=1 Tax=Ostrinia nubilalis TaxID=29057 RepID=UPI0030823176